MQQARLTYLLKQYKADALSASEGQELSAFLHLEEGSGLFNHSMTELLEQTSWRDVSLAGTAGLADKVLRIDQLGAEADTYLETASPLPAADRVHFLRTAWFRYAAVLLLIAGTATFLYRYNRPPGELITKQPTISTPGIQPGGNKAILTLSDGSTIVLDSAANGQLTDQGGVRVVKLANGQITYDLRGLAYASKEVMWNTMSTPKGGQYQVTLPDGTKVWLNASSSITFPTAFVHVKREVKIKGEVYFEVTQNKAKPFTIDVDGKSLIEVLGTSFNINSYTDEASIKTTLLEGSVKVNSSVVLKPGQQATQYTNTSSVATIADKQLKITQGNITQALAWKDGIFDFTGADLKTVMRQLERWYDIKVYYKGSISNDITFEGRMYRNVNLSDVLEVLQEMGVKFELDGKSLIVL